MNLYAFELGRKKELCFAELIAVLGEKALVEKNLDSAIFNLSDTDDAPALQDRLGGTIKIVKIVETLSKKASIEKIKAAIEKLLKIKLSNHTGKIQFSISALSYKNPGEINIKQLLIFSKKIIKSLGLNGRFVNTGNFSPPPATIYKARVIEKGIDINIIKGDQEIFIGETVSIQDIGAYTTRDSYKPKRDPTVGMMPPKLAQIMINLAGETKTIFDPFCGTGTILMEGLLMDKTVVGSDISPKMVNYSNVNLDWLQDEFKTTAHARVFERDAKFLNKNLVPEKIDAIITEGYLGWPVTRLPYKEDQEKIFRELENLYINWLRAAHKILGKDGKIVMCCLAYKDNSSLIHLPHLDEIIKESGYRLIEKFIYDRPDQIVAREIVVIQK